MDAAAAALAPSLLARTAHARVVVPVREAYGLFGVLLLAFAGYLALPYAAVPLTVLVGAVGCRLAWQRRKGAPAPSRWLTSRRTFAFTCAAVDLCAVVTYFGWGRLAAVLAAMALEVLLRRRSDTAPTVTWHSHTRLSGALVNAGVLAAPKDQALPTLSYRGRPQHDERGSTVTVDLPAGVTYEQVQTKRKQLASALGVAERSLVVSHDPADPANAVTLWVGTAKPTEPVPSELATTEQTVWSEPFRIGTDQQGRPVTLSLFEQNVIVGGRMGYGKTTTVRVPLLQVILDPRSRGNGLDGKGARKDYNALKPLCDEWIWGTDADAVERTLRVFHKHLAIVRERNSTEDEPEGGWPCQFLLLEEYQVIRTAANREQQAELDEVLGNIVREQRAVGGLLIVSTQRPSVDDLPAGVRNLLSLGLCMNVRPDDARIVLGTTPDLPIPSEPGVAIFGSPRGQVLVDVDLIDLPAWKAACARALARRPVAPVSLVKPEPVDLTTPVVPVDPFGDAVRNALALGPMTPTALLESLPADLRPGTPQALAQRIGRLSDVERGRNGNSRTYRLRASENCRSDAFPGLPHAQTGVPGQRASETTVLP